MEKVIGVLEGAGGISEKFEDLVKSIQKNTGAVLILDPDPKNLVKKVIDILKKESGYGKTDCF